MSKLPKGVERIKRIKSDPVAEGLENWAANLAGKLTKPQKRVKRVQRKMQYGQKPKFKMNWVRKLIHKITGRRYHYQLTIRYGYEQDMNGQWPDNKYIGRTVTVAIIDPAILEHDRALNKELAPALIKSIPRIYLRNGLIQIRDINFLGVW